jgi:DNA-binding transcriptional LysR family regulator
MSTNPLPVDIIRYITNMNEIHLLDLDLNLLVVLAELLRTRSTTEAARRLGRTQSAVSHALGRLRKLLHDPLFVRSGGALQPTSLAEGLEAPLREVLEQAGAIFAGHHGAFEPSRLERTFVIGGTDLSELIIMPRLLSRLRQEAPGVTVLSRFLGDDLERALLAREVDLVFGTRFRALAGVVVQTVGHEPMVMLAREGHPQARKGLTTEQFAALDHVVVTPRQLPGSAVDAALEPLGYRRRVVLQLPHFVAAAFIVARTDLVLTVPRLLARSLRGLLPLRELPLPFEMPGFSFAIAFHAQRQDDPAHRWLRQAVVEACQQGMRARR